MKKLSLYLGDVEVERLRRIAVREGRSQTEVLRAAILAYDAGTAPYRNFALAGSWEGDGTSVADVSENELLKGFGS